jgi:hypothetical protein
MILIGNEYHKRKQVFIAKHMKSGVPSASKQELMYDHWLRKRIQAVNLTVIQKQG